MDETKLSTNDYLAIERTKLANERTLLAYVRTFIILLSSGIAIIKLDFFNQIDLLGIILISIAPILFIFGVVRYNYMKKRISTFIKQN